MLYTGILSSFQNVSFRNNVSTLYSFLIHEATINFVMMHMKMYQIQATFQTPTHIYLQVESIQILIVIIFMNTL